MINEQNKVAEFMSLAGQETPARPQIPDDDVQKLRVRLHDEEAVKELREAFDKNSIPLVLDSLCDSLVVVFGTAVACGISPEMLHLGFQEVMRSNMTKFIDGHRREDGKWMKGPSYTPPNLTAIVERMTA